jgi:tRNA (mo5U34)-methyltransferase
MAIPASNALRARLERFVFRYRAGSSTAEPGGLEFGPILQPDLLTRDPSRALDFLRPRSLAGDGNGPSIALHEDQERRSRQRSGTPTLRQLVDSVTWYHTIELPGGVTTPGYYDHRPLVPSYHLPTTLHGHRVLDVATFNGFWAFEMERRGATVVALDLSSSFDFDLQPAMREVAHTEGADFEVGTAFYIAAEALGSDVERRTGNVYDLNSDGWGLFDLVHVGDLLLHLERPQEALRAVRSVTSGVLHLAEVFDPTLPRSTVRYSGGWSDLEWWIPSLEALTQWVVDAGYRDVEVLSTYKISPTGRRDAFWRAIIRAKP